MRGVLFVLVAALGVRCNEEDDGYLFFSCHDEETNCTKKVANGECFANVEVHKLGQGRVPDKTNR
jgi:hypothetical protein